MWVELFDTNVSKSVFVLNVCIEDCIQSYTIKFYIEAFVPNNSNKPVPVPVLNN